MRRRMPYLLLAAACGTTPVAGAESSSGQPTPVGSTTTDATTSTTASLSTGSSSATAADETAGVAFIANPDGGLVHIECSHFEQDCPRGEKCSAWANDGGNAWNATHCVPIDANPDGIGDPCSVEVAPLSGVDSCERGSTCWFIGVDVNGEGAGRCVANCSGSLSAPTCEDPNSDCVLTRALALCIPNCNPVVPNPCGAGQGCYPLDNRFECQPDASGKTGGAFEDCEFTNACNPGLACIGSDVVGLCDSGVDDCCTPWCDTTAPTCPGGTQCVPYFERGSTPPGYEDIGICGQNRG